MTLLTRKGQTPLELSQEFFTAVQKTEKMTSILELADQYCKIEPVESTDSKALTHYEANFTKGVADIRMLPIMQNNKFPMTLTFLNWICSQCDGHSAMFECLLGMMATVFYHTHHKSEKMTLQWLMDNNAVFWMQNKDMFYWHLASLTKVHDDPVEFNSVFTVMKPEDYYTFKI